MVGLDSNFVVDGFVEEYQGAMERKREEDGWKGLI
jgi:hypothetical protein